MREPDVIVIGKCSATSARILIADHPGENFNTQNTSCKGRIYYKTNDSALQFRDFELLECSPLVRNVVVLDDLAESARVTYTVLITYGDETLPDNNVFSEHNSYSFKLLPKNRPLKIALISCNRTRLYPDPDTQFIMWQKLQAQLQQNDFDLLIHSGDQIYADDDHNIYQNYVRDLFQYNSNRRFKSRSAPDLNSLLEDYRLAYYDSWTQPEVSAVLRSCPSIMMWDDHDIVDGWGARGFEQDDRMKLLYEAAETTFKEFQLSLNDSVLNSAHSFASDFVFEDTAILLLDTRKNRDSSTGTILGKEQFSDIKNWLDTLGDVKYLYIVQPKPIVFGDIPGIPSLITSLLGNKDDLDEFWSSKKNYTECSRLLMTLFDYYKDHPDTRMCVFSGDLHVAYVANIESNLPQHQRNGHPLRIHEIVSSGIGNQGPSGLSKDIFMKFIDEDQTIHLLDNDIYGNILTIAKNPAIANDRIICKRNFAIIKPTDSSGSNEDKNKNIWVDYHIEGERRVFERCLIERRG